MPKTKNRDHLAAVLRSQGKTVSARTGENGSALEAPGTAKRGAKRRAEGKRGGRPRLYGTEFTRTLRRVWEICGQMCGKLLVSLIRSTIDFLAEIYRLLGPLYN